MEKYHVVKNDKTFRLYDKKDANLSGTLRVSTGDKYFSNCCCSSFVKFLINSSKFRTSYTKHELQL